MILHIADKPYRVEVIRSMLTGGVAFLIPCHGGFDLTALAVDALRAFTQDTSHEVWVIDNASDRATRRRLEGLAVNLILNHTRPQPWWRRQRAFGSWANGVALEIASQVLRTLPHPARFFVMHNDALPLRAGWLSELDRLRGQRGAVAIGVKTDPHPDRIQAMHVSGFLVPAEIAFSTSFLPHLPHLDAGDRITAEIRARHHTVFATPWHAHRPGECPPNARPCAAWPEWLRGVACDVSSLEGTPYYVHKGGGSTMRQTEIAPWVRTAREALGL